VAGNPILVAACLVGDTGERLAFGLRLDHSAGLAINEQQVVAGACRKGIFPHRYPKARPEVHLAAILDHPARRPKLGVNELAGRLFGRRHHRDYCVSLALLATDWLDMANPRVMDGAGRFTI
jgi:hypothetical protein